MPRPRSPTTPRTSPSNPTSNSPNGEGPTPLAVFRFGLDFGLLLMRYTQGMNVTIKLDRKHVQIRAFHTIKSDLEFFLKREFPQAIVTVVHATTHQIHTAACTPEQDQKIRKFVNDFLFLEDEEEEKLANDPAEWEG